MCANVQRNGCEFVTACFERMCVQIVYFRDAPCHGWKIYVIINARRCGRQDSMLALVL